MKLLLIMLSFSIAAKVSAAPSWFINHVENDSLRSTQVKASVAHKDVWQDQPTRVIKLGVNWIDGNKEGFTYLDEGERQAYKLTFENGRIFDAKGNEFSAPHGAMFVMAEDGSIYASKKTVVNSFEHHSLLAGQPVVCAGRIVVEAGKLKDINDFSAQYKANGYYFLTKVITKLEKSGVSLRNVTVNYNVDNQ